MLVCIKTSEAQNFTSPEVFSYKQEVFRPVSFYTGYADISIPLFEIKTNEITIPISLKYIGGEGLRAINPYSNVGFGWKLSAGGMITRTVNGEPDEFNTPGTGRLLGFFNLPSGYISNESVRNNANSFLIPNGSGVRFISNYEYSPDIFSFSFLSYSGYFVMGYDKNFKIQSQDIVKVEKFDNNLPNLSNNPFYLKLTANDGTKFTFGYTEGSIELAGGTETVPYQCIAWYLTTIEFTNGKRIDFNYKTNISKFIHFKRSQFETQY